MTGEHDCHINATCNDTSPLWTCDCSMGFSGSGRSCQGEFSFRFSTPKGHSLSPCVCVCIVWLTLIAGLARQGYIVSVWQNSLDLLGPHWIWSSRRVDRTKSPSVRIASQFVKCTFSLSWIVRVMLLQWRRRVDRIFRYFWHSIKNGTTSSFAPQFQHIGVSAFPNLCRCSYILQWPVCDRCHQNSTFRKL